VPEAISGAKSQLELCATPIPALTAARICSASFVLIGPTGRSVATLAGPLNSQGRGRPPDVKTTALWRSRPAGILGSPKCLRYSGEATVTTPNASDASRKQRRVSEEADTDRDIEPVLDQIDVPLRDVDVDCEILIAGKEFGQPRHDIHAAETGR
jgi:hypothetical protein